MNASVQQIVRSIIAIGFILFLSFGQFARAAELSPVSFKVIGKNGEVLDSHQDEVSLPQTAGQVTVHFLEKNQIPFVGDADGIVSIYSLGSDLEVLSDTEMKAYGWCYSVNGVVPEDFVHKINITESNTEIIWFYGYAHYKLGEWIAQCVRSE